MTFYSQMTSALAPIRLDPPELFRLYRQACSGTDAPCLSQDVAWIDCPTCSPVLHGIKEAAVALTGSGELTAAQTDRTLTLGDLNGVSQDPTP